MDVFDGWTLGEVLHEAERFVLRRASKEGTGGLARVLRDPRPDALDLAVLRHDFAMSRHLDFP